MSYKKRSTQQYALQREKVLSKVETKLKVAKKKSPKQIVETTPAIAPTTAVPVTAPAKPLPPGHKATLHYKDEKIKVTAKVRYETENVDPLIKTVHVADGKIVNKRYIGPQKREVWMDAEGKEHDKSKVQTMQKLDDGKLIPIEITKTSDMKVEPVPAKIMDDFHPYSFLEVWGEDEGDVEGLREVAYQLKSKGEVGAVKQFSHGYGKMYVGFLKPVMSSDGKHFVLELMLSENKRSRRRWMPTDITVAKKEKAQEPVVPELW